MMGMGDREVEDETPQAGRSLGASQRPGGGWICPNALAVPAGQG